MKLATTRFGELNLNEDRLLFFSRGLIGFEDCHRFCLLDFGDPDSGFKWLQSADRGDLAFVIADPTLFAADYAPVLPGSVQKELNLKSFEEAVFMGICVIPEKSEESTVNLLAPVVINPVERLASQVVLSDQSYPMRHRMFVSESRRAKEG